MNIILSGYGTMNQLVAQVAQDQGHTIVGVVAPNQQEDYPSLDSFNQASADLIIDFSHPDHLLPLLEEDLQVPIVVATTGEKDKIQAALHQQADHVPVFFEANMSYGIHALSQILEKALSLLQDYDVELLEAHHNQKVDAPSGTLVKLLDLVSEARPDSYPNYDRHEASGKRNPDEIGIHTLRGGSIVGDHEVLFAGPDESIKISHQAGSKAIFARGALRAGAKLIDKEPGYYNFDNL